MKFSEGENPEKPKGDMVTYKPLKESGDKEKDKEEKSEAPETQE